MSGAGRIVSVDALRGFDMFWIIGGDFLFHYLAASTRSPILTGVSDQLRHAEWAGFHAYDLVFPLFMFLSGVSIGLVMGRGEPAAAPLTSRPIALRHAFRRALILVAFGVFYNWGWDIDIAQVRFASVLGLIGGAYLITVLIVTVVRDTRYQVLAAVVILGVVALLQLVVPVPGVGAGVLTPDGSINGWIDRSLLPGRLYGGAYDPEGLLGVFSGVSITLAGAVIGGHMMRARVEGRIASVGRIAVIGAALIAIGLVISPYYPPIKKIWTATFDVMAIGASMMLLAGAIWLFDRKTPRSSLFSSSSFFPVAFFFVVIGANSILIYMVARYFVYPVYKLAEEMSWSPGFSAGVIAAVIAVQWLFLYFLYRKRLFLRV